MELPQPPLKIYVAANGPRMIQLAGEIADGMVGWFHSVEYVRDVRCRTWRRAPSGRDATLDGFDVTSGSRAS